MCSSQSWGNIPKSVILHAETICVCSAFIFIVGLLQVMISLTLRFLQRSVLVWYLYPEWSAATSLAPFVFALIHCANKKNRYIVLTCIFLMISFLASFCYVANVIVNLFSSGLDENARSTSFLLHYRMLMIQSTNSPTVWDTLPFIILVLSVVQSLLSFGGSFMCFIWSQCCSHDLNSAINGFMNGSHKIYHGHNYTSHGAGGIQASPLLTIRKRPNYCSETLRSHMVPSSTLHRPNFVNGHPSNTLITNGVVTSGIKGGHHVSSLDEPSDLYVARSMLRRQQQNMIDEV